MKTRIVLSFVFVCAACEETVIPVTPDEGESESESEAEAEAEAEGGPCGTTMGVPQPEMCAPSGTWTLGCVADDGTDVLALARAQMPACDPGDHGYLFNDDHLLMYEFELQTHYDPATHTAADPMDPNDQWANLCTDAREQAVADALGVNLSHTTSWGTGRMRVGDEVIEGVGMKMFGVWTLSHEFFHPRPGERACPAARSDVPTQDEENTCRAKTAAAFSDCLNMKFGPLATGFPNAVPTSGTIYKPSLKVKLGMGQKFHGQKHLKFKSDADGDSLMRDWVAHKLAANAPTDTPSGLGLNFPRNGHALVCINGHFKGVFATPEITEDKHFLKRTYGHGSSPAAMCGDDDGHYFRVSFYGPQDYAHSTPDHYREHVEDSTEPNPGKIDKGYLWTANSWQTSPTDMSPEPPFTDTTDIITLLRFGNFTDDATFMAAAETDPAVKIDVDEWLAMSAFEIASSDLDGSFADRHNYLLYNHPHRGWQFLRYDMNQIFKTTFDACGPRSFPGISSDCMGNSPHIGNHLFDTTPDYNHDIDNQCDGTVGLDTGTGGRCPNETGGMGDTHCAGAVAPYMTTNCTCDQVRHPVIQSRLMHVFKDRYMAALNTYLTGPLSDANVTAIDAAIDARRDQLAPFAMHDPWKRYSPDWTPHDIQSFKDQINAVRAMDMLEYTNAMTDPTLEAPSADWPNACAPAP